MANFVAIVDPDPARREAFMRAVREGIALLPGLVLGGATLGSFAIAWAAGERAPIHVAQDPDAVGVVMGDAFAGPPYERVDARVLRSRWRSLATGAPPAFDGFHAAVLYDTAHGLTAGSDVFGLFPVHYADHGGVTLVGSTAELFALHPLFPAALDPVGLVGILLAHGPLEGRCLLRGVRRLAPGCVLRSHDGRATEVPNYRIADAGAPDGRPFRVQVEHLGEACAAAVDRMAPPDRPVGVLLSGGRDSRLFSGYLGERARGATALTLGRRGDHEARCAAAVARTLGMAHAIVEPDESLRAMQAALQARWEHLASGFSNVHMWGAVEPLRHLPPRFITGYVRESLEYVAPTNDFDQLMETRLNRGFSPAQLRRLLRPSLRDLVDERHAAMRVAFEASSPHEAERPRRFRLAHYARIHPGGVAWRLSFGSWPVLPILDRALLDLTASLPLSTVGARRAEDAILRERFPALARLPLDRNHHDTEPLTPSTIRHALNGLIVRGRELRARLARVAGLEGERRYYYRVYDIDGPGWRQVRREAEPAVERLADVFDMGELRRWLPPPAEDMRPADPIVDAFRPKTLLGLALWARARSLT